MQPPLQFFGLLTRNFIATFMHQLTKGAGRVYAYLRTWCISPAGQASDWRSLPLTKIAKDLSWSTRYVRKNLRELENKGLVERKAQFVEGEGKRAQAPNVYRILPEPGFPVDQPPAKDDAEPKEVAKASKEDLLAARTKTASAMLDAILSEIDGVIDNVPSWAATAARKAEEERDSALELARWLETDADAQSLAGMGGPELIPTRIRQMRELAEEHAADMLVCTAIAALPAIEAAAHPRFISLVVETLGNRAIRSLSWTRERQKGKLTRRIVLAVLREEFKSRGVELTEEATRAALGEGPTQAPAPSSEAHA